MKLNRDVLMKIGIVVAITIIIYLLYKSHNCKNTYAEFVGEEDAAENMFAEDAADYAEETDDYADYAEEADSDEAAEYVPEDDEGVENFTLMESAVDDSHANAMFEPYA